MVPVTRLPDLALLEVFKQLPPSDQLNARKVCLRWAALVPESTRKVRSLALLVARPLWYATMNLNPIHSLQSMQLLVKEDGKQMYPSGRITEWNSLQFKKLDEYIVHQITSTFRNVTKLLFDEYSASSQCNYLVTLLEQWRHQLITFKLVECFSDSPSESQTVQIFDAINSMSALKNLSLNLRRLEYRDLSILAQLEEFTFYEGYYKLDTYSVIESLQRYITSNSTLRIQTDYSLEMLNTLSSELRGRFFRLNAKDRFPCAQLRSICTNFRSLTSLSMEYSGISIRHFFAQLSQLTELIYLDILIPFGEMTTTDQSPVQMAQLKSVKALKVNVDDISVKRLSELKLNWTVPNIQVLELECSLGTCDCETYGVESCCQLFGRRYYHVDYLGVLDSIGKLVDDLERDCAQLPRILCNLDETDPEPW